MPPAPSGDSISYGPSFLTSGERLSFIKTSYTRNINELAASSLGIRNGCSISRFREKRLSEWMAKNAFEVWSEFNEPGEWKGN